VLAQRIAESGAAEVVQVLDLAPVLIFSAWSSTLQTKASMLALSITLVCRYCARARTSCGSERVLALAFVLGNYP
jgi:hypothetical protein